MALFTDKWSNYIISAVINTSKTYFGFQIFQFFIMHVFVTCSTISCVIIWEECRRAAASLVTSCCYTPIETFLQRLNLLCQILVIAFHLNENEWFEIINEADGRVKEWVNLMETVTTRLKELDHSQEQQHNDITKVTSIRKVLANLLKQKLKNKNTEWVHPSLHSTLKNRHVWQEHTQKSRKVHFTWYSTSGKLNSLNVRHYVSIYYLTKLKNKSQILFFFKHERILQKQNTSVSTWNCSKQNDWKNKRKHLPRTTIFLELKFCSCSYL